MNVRRCVIVARLGLGLALLGLAGADNAGREGGQPALEAALVNGEKNTPRGWATTAQAQERE